MSTSHRDPALTGDHTVPILPVGRMTEDEFLAWADEETRAEWVDGEVVVMSPSNPLHADLLVWLGSLLRFYVDARGLGKVLADCTVRLEPPPRRRGPDLAFVARDRLDRIRRNCIEGPPDLIVEIVSPDSEERDWREKRLDYESGGVREYWVIDPQSRRFEVHTLTPAAGDAPPRYRRLEEQNGRISSAVLPGFELTVAWLWADPLPPLNETVEQVCGPSNEEPKP